MAHKEKNLNVYSEQLVSHLDDLKEKKKNLETQIAAFNDEQSSLEQEMQRLTARLSELNESIVQKNESKIQYMAAIAETEANYMKALQYSQNTLKVLKKGK